MINVVIYTDGDPKAIEPDFVEDLFYRHGIDVYRVEVRHVESIS